MAKTAPLQLAAVVTLSPERQRLVEAIEARAEAAQRLKQLRARDTLILLREPRQALERARKAEATAIQYDQDAAVRAIIDGQPTPVPTVEQARAAVTKAETALRTVEAALGVMKDEIGELERGQFGRDHAVQQAIGEVIASERDLEAMADEIEALKCQLIDKVEAFKALRSQTFKPGPRSRLDSAADTLEMMPKFWTVFEAADHPTLTAWRATIAELESDASAPLPL